jgi:mRNA-degrading endonuclease RelE of RelBE toxin-antitoxin system
LINCLYKTTFLKDLSKVNPSQRRTIEELVFEEIPALSSIFDTSNIKKMKAYDTYYRIRKGQYRIGIKIEDSQTVVFYRVKNRSDIYKVFP